MVSDLQQDSEAVMIFFEQIYAGMSRAFLQPRRRRCRAAFGPTADGLETRELMTFVTVGGFETEPNNSLAMADTVSINSTSAEFTSRL
jgi:hypothetical protein